MSSMLLTISLTTMPYLFDFSSPYSFNLGVEQAYLYGANNVLIRFVGTDWVTLSKQFVQSTSFNFNN